MKFMLLSCRNKVSVPSVEVSVQEYITQVGRISPSSYNGIPYHLIVFNRSLIDGEVQIKVFRTLPISLPRVLFPSYPPTTAHLAISPLPISEPASTLQSYPYAAQHFPHDDLRSRIGVKHQCGKALLHVCRACHSLSLF